MAWAVAVACAAWGFASMQEGVAGVGAAWEPAVVVTAAPCAAAACEFASHNPSQAHRWGKSQSACEQETDFARAAGQKAVCTACTHACLQRADGRGHIQPHKFTLQPPGHAVSAFAMRKHPNCPLVPPGTFDGASTTPWRMSSEDKDKLRCCSGECVSRAAGGSIPHSQIRHYMVTSDESRPHQASHGHVRRHKCTGQPSSTCNRMTPCAMCKGHSRDTC